MMAYSMAWQSWGLNNQLDPVATDLSVHLPSYGCAVDVIRSTGMKRHTHPSWEMTWVHSGAVVLSIDDWCEILTPGDLVLFDGSAMHGFCPVGSSYTRTAVHFAYQLAPTIETHLSPRVPLTMSVTGENACHIVGDVVQLREALAHAKPDTPVTVDMAKLLLQLRKAPNSPPRALLPTLVGDVLDFMIQHPELSVSLSDLSDRFHVSRGHLCRLFKENLGYSPQNIWLRVRIQHSCNLLLNQASIASASKATGFATRRGFERAFRRVTGCSPGDYRESVGLLSPGGKPHDVTSGRRRTQGADPSSR